MFRRVWSVRPSGPESNEGRVLDKSAAARCISQFMSNACSGGFRRGVLLLPENLWFRERGCDFEA